MSSDLWPDFSANKVKSPKTVLIEQANFFNEKVKNVLTATVNTNSGGGNKSIIHSFNIIAPALGNYSFNLFHIKHDVIFYPLEVIYDSVKLAQSEEMLIEEMRKIFNSEETKKVISSLYSQSI